jgi:hypothetical protein
MRPRLSKYQLWVVHTAAEAQLYLWEKWKYLLPLVDTLVSLSPAKAFMRSRQAIESENAWLGFGRMSWDKENNEKWTRLHKENESKGRGVRFFNTEIWAPDWNQVEKTGVFPDIYVRLYNEPDSRITREGLIIAIKHAIVEKNTAAIEPVIADISRTVPHSTVISITRSWGPGAGFVNHIQDMNNWELKTILEDRDRPSLAVRILSIFSGKRTDA